MDSAICGEGMRSGYSRCGVFRDDWDRLLAQYKNVPAKASGMDPAVWNHCRWDYCRWDVYIPLFDAMKTQMEK